MKKRRYVYVHIAIVFGLLFMLGGYLFLQWADKPSSQTVSTPSSNENGVSKTQTIDTELYTFTLPEKFKVEIKEHPTIKGMTQLNGYEKQGTGIQVGVTTSPLPTGGLLEVADYAYRVKNQSLYQKQQSLFAGAVSFVRTDDTNELSDFLLHGSLYASIVVSSDAASIDQVNTTRSQIASSWSWK